MEPLSWPPSFSQAAVLFVLLSLLYKFYIYLTHPLRKFPGPPLAALTNLPYSLWSFSGRREFTILELHHKYGPVVRVAPNELSFDSAQSWKDIYGFRRSVNGHERVFPKSDFYDGSAFSHMGIYGIIVCRDVAEHAKMRRYLSNAFSASALRTQEPLVAEIIDIFVEKVGVIGSKPEGIDLRHWLRMCTFDITGSLAFGTSFGAIENDGKHPSVRFIHDALKMLSVIDAMKRFPWLGKLFIVFMFPTFKRLVHGNTMHEEFALRTIRERLAKPTKRADFLTRITEEWDKEGQIQDIQLAAHAADLLQAGSDTVSTTLSTVFNYILRDPALLQRLKDEIVPTFSCYDDINAQTTANFPLLRAVIQESLRIYPPVPLGLSREAPKGGDVVDGFFIPGGTRVSTNALAANLAEKHFDNPLNFRPERWMKGTRETGTDVLEASQPFSLGSRACLGKNLAWIEMNTIVCKLLYRYDLELLNPEVDLHRDSKVDCLWTGPALMVRFRPGSG